MPPPVPFAPGLAPGTEPESLLAVLVPLAPGIVGPVIPLLPVLGRPLVELGRGRVGNVNPRLLELELGLLACPELLLEEPCLDGCDNLGSEGRGTLTLPPPLEPLLDVEPDEVLGAGAGGVAVLTVFLTHFPREGLSTSPAGQTVRPDAAPAVIAPPSESARALTVTTPARRTVVLGVMGVMPPRVWDVLQA
jgi:hypothetical protein